MWRVAKSFKKPFTQLLILEDNNDTYNTEVQKGEAFEKHFAKKFRNNLQNNAKQQLIEDIANDIGNMEPQNVPNSKLISPKGVMEAVMKIRNRKAPGSDQINGLMLKNLNKKAFV